ncbi:quinone oxidoreductase family protein [Brevibacterium sp. LE-L]|uniref:quinone oxidoreductase family protein n=1 Tax=Brevibacterium sp. LE-L TaxID=3418557 RepID=UPI003CFBBD5C
MKAAVVHEIGNLPRYEDFPDPIPGDGEVMIDVKAVAVENLDREIVAGHHFSSGAFAQALPAIPCFDGVGTLQDGTLVGFGGVRPPYGALAQRVVVAEEHVSPVPDGLEPAVAVVLASAVTGFTISTAGDFEPGKTVLVQGATGVAGRLAVQIARKLGAGRIVATGRREDTLREAALLGADATINTAVSDEELVAAFREHSGDGYDIVLDFLWGRPTELLLHALTPEELGFVKPTRIVQVGSSAGESLTVPAAAVRTSGVELVGATKELGPESMAAAYKRAAGWAHDGELVFNIERVPLSQIESAWTRTDLAGKRLVVIAG